MQPALLFASLAGVSVLVGVLEQPPQCQEDRGRSVRVLFERRPAGWFSLADDKQAPAEFPSRWTVAFDGRNLGQITTVDPGWSSEYMWTYPRDRLLNVVGEAPTVRPSDQLFEGWCAASSQRPLVVVSRPNVVDPSRWRRDEPTKDTRDQLFDEFKKHAGHQVNCPADAEKPVDFPYTVMHLVQLGNYSDQLGRRLVAVSLDPKLNMCDGPSEPAWRPNWFMLPEGGYPPVFLGAGLWLVDAGDYDADGHSEAIFWFTGYNRDGYVLFTDDYATRVEYLWNYH
jgi:hypothetical protein